MQDVSVSREVRDGAHSGDETKFGTGSKESGKDDVCADQVQDQACSEGDSETEMASEDAMETFETKEKCERVPVLRIRKQEAPGIARLILEIQQPNLNLQSRSLTFRSLTEW